MNKFDEEYEIRLAQKADIDSIMLFIEKYWKKEHLLARDREFFEYEFLEEDGSVNFILAFSKETRDIEGILGYLKASHDRERMDMGKCLEGERREQGSVGIGNGRAA